MKIKNQKKKISLYNQNQKQSILSTHQNPGYRTNNSLLCNACYEKFGVQNFPRHHESMFSDIMKLQIQKIGKEKEGVFKC